MNNNFKGKSIIIGSPTYFDINKILIKELQNVGFDNVVEFSLDVYSFKYKSIFQRAGSFIKKTIGNQPNYKQMLGFNEVEPELQKKLDEIENIDYALILRPDTYSASFLDKIRSKTKKFCTYQWDGLSRYPTIDPLISKFDRFFVFDSSDLCRDGVLPTTNFCMSSLTHEQLFDEKLATDVYYLGSYYKDRLPVLFKMLTQLKSIDLKVKYIFKSSKPNPSKVYPLITTDQPLTFEENLKNTYNSKIIIDLVYEGHQGLSFRVFEALTFDKKIITTNESVKQYDFYDPNNIFVWTNNTTVEELNSFVSKPVHPVSQHLKHKYSFENWINYVLDVGDYTPIGLPDT